MNHIVLLVILVLLLMISAILSSSETALFSLSPMRVQSFKRDKARGKRLAAKLLTKPRDLLVTILMINMAMNILVQNVVSGLFGTFSTWALTVGVPLVLTLVFGEALPKTIAIGSNTSVAPKVAPLLYFISRALGPLRRAVNTMTGYISHFLFFFLRKGKEISIEELRVAMKASKEHGVLNQDEVRLINGYLSLEEDVAKELMRPRQEMIYFDVNDPIEDLVKLFVDDECSRIPIIREDQENILGILTNEVFLLHREEIKSGEDLIPLLKKPFYVPEMITARSLLSDFNRKHETFAIVVDEYGSLSGLITKEDLVELVVGQIEDKRDDVSLFTRSGADVIIASGKLELDVLEEQFDVKLASPSNMATIGGWLIEQMGDIPRSGAKHVTDDFLFYILSATETRIRRVYIRKLKQARKRRLYGK
ncbi:MAG: hemolysin family protein [Simkaniaceae bacterium]|nr:hemolysin family protein [Simkaniaceae bacterium]